MLPFPLGQFCFRSINQNEEQATISEGKRGGASPRAGIALLRVAQARAPVAGRSFLEPDDVKAVAVAVLAHRLILAPEARSSGLTGERIVQETLEKTPVPV